MKLESLLQYVDHYLGVIGHPDYPNALNGLQVAGAEEVAVVATAVDASQASIEAAIDLGANLLMVHHGLFWDGLEPVVGRNHKRLAALLGSNMALYSSHLPLDAHAEIGNCALLGRAVGLELEGRFGTYQGADLGWWGQTERPTTAQALVDAVASAVDGPVHLIPGGPDRVQRVGVLTGAGGSFAREAAKLGLDALVTGEGSHHTHFDATEFGIHVLFAGHYATETLGIQALGAHIADRFGLEAHFIDQPTGL